MLSLTSICSPALFGRHAPERHPLLPQRQECSREFVVLQQDLKLVQGTVSATVARCSALGQSLLILTAQLVKQPLKYTLKLDFYVVARGMALQAQVLTQDGYHTAF